MPVLDADILLRHRVKANFNDSDFEALKKEARLRGLTEGACVREIVRDFLRNSMSREGTLLLEAVAEFRENYLDILGLTLSRQLTQKSMDEAVEANLLNRRMLARKFLESPRQVTDLPSEEDSEEDTEED